MKHRQTLTAVVLALLFSGAFGCASLPKSAKGPVFTPVTVPAGKAVVYFFRTDKFAMSANTIFMSIPHAANNCFGMVTAGYYPFVTDPGSLTVSSAARGGQKQFTIDLKAGDVKYVKVDFNSDFIPKTFYQEIAPAEALPEISQYRMIEACR
jgi:hypothetical protein